MEEPKPTGNDVDMAAVATDEAKRRAIPKSDAKGIPIRDRQHKSSLDNWGFSQRNSDGSTFSDSDVTNFSSSPNSTWKSDVSVGYNKPMRPSREEAVATLDNFLNDVSQIVEKAKLEEGKKRPTKSVEKPVSIPTPSTNPTRKWKSLPSVVSEESDDFDLSTSDFSKSQSNVRYSEFEVFSDEEAAEPVKKVFKFPKNMHKNNLSMSSQGSYDVPVPDSYGINHLNQLCKFLEGYKQLQIQNTELTRRVTDLEESRLRPTSASYETILGGQPPAPPRNSMVFIPPKEKAKKSKPGKFKGLNTKQKMKSRYHALTNLPSLLAARSVENLKFSSSHNFDRPKDKQTPPKRLQNYSHDDLEVGKCMHDSNDWRNSSVKSPSSKEAEKTFVSPDLKRTESDVVDAHLKEQPIHSQTPTPTIVINKVTLDQPGEEKPEPEKKPDVVVKKVFPTKQTSPTKAKDEERNYKNIKKMTEWGALQQAFPVPQIESNLDLLNHLETIVNTNKAARKSQAYKKHSRFYSKKDKGVSSNMYLPSAPTQGFTSTCLAAQAMANQLTLTLNLSDLETLSAATTENKPQSSIGGQAIPIP